MVTDAHTEWSTTYAPWTLAEATPMPLGGLSIERSVEQPYVNAVVRQCSHSSRRHLGRGWLVCNLCGEHTYEEA